MSGVIFLDFDGPIFPDKVFLFEENRKGKDCPICKELNLHPFITYWKADPFAVQMINKIVEISNCELVISSSWADDRMQDKEQIKKLLELNGFNAPIHADWRTPRDMSYREDQIADWLMVHPTDNYLILDDVKSGPGLEDLHKLAELRLNKKNVFLIDTEDGITYKQFLQMLKVVQSWI